MPSLLPTHHVNPKETTSMSTPKPPVPMTPETAAIVALAMPLVTQFAAEIAKSWSAPRSRAVAPPCRLLG
jgi:hypothetical protein